MENLYDLDFTAYDRLQTVNCICYTAFKAVLPLGTFSKVFGVNNRAIPRYTKKGVRRLVSPNILRHIFSFAEGNTSVTYDILPNQPIIEEDIDIRHGDDFWIQPINILNRSFYADFGRKHNETQVLRNDGKLVWFPKDKMPICKNPAHYCKRCGNCNWHCVCLPVEEEVQQNNPNQQQQNIPVDLGQVHGPENDPCIESIDYYAGTFCVDTSSNMVIDDC